MLIEIEKIEKSYSQQKVLNGLDFTFQPGSITCIIGNNASGKSTLLRVLVGLVKQDSGRINYRLGQSVYSYEKAKKYFGYAGNNELLIENITGFEYLTFIQRIYRIPRKEFKKRLDKIIDYFTLDASILSGYISNYSSGYKKLIETIGALIHHPSVIILDEPFNGLDNTFSDLLKKYLVSLKEQQITIVIATHDRTFVDLYSDSILAL